MKKKQLINFDWKALEQTHDLSLSDWGPFSARTFGISHIHNPETGTILDMVLMPGFYRRPLAIPDARRPSGGIPWRCSSDLKHVTSLLVIFSICVTKFRHCNDVASPLK